jgi:hypothetical protein
MLPCLKSEEMLFGEGHIYAPVQLWIMITYLVVLILCWWGVMVMPTGAPSSLRGNRHILTPMMV